MPKELVMLDGGRFVLRTNYYAQRYVTILFPNTCNDDLSAFGSSMARVCPVAVLVAGSRHVAVYDVNSRYLNYYTSDLRVTNLHCS